MLVNPNLVLKFIADVVLQSIIISFKKFSSKNLLQRWCLPQLCNSCLCFLSSEEYFNVVAGKFA